MKISLNLLLLLGVIIGACSCNKIQATKTYLNFKSQYVNAWSGNCNPGDEPGFAYSILVGYCFSIDENFSHLLSVNTSSKGGYTHYTYNTAGSGTNCNSSPSYVEQIEIGSCQPLTSFNQQFPQVSNSLNTAFEISISKIPSTSYGGQYVNTYYTSNSCNNQNIFAIESYPSSTDGIINDGNIQYTCNNGEPTETICEYTGSCQSSESTQKACAIFNEHDDTYASTFCTGSGSIISHN